MSAYDQGYAAWVARAHDPDDIRTNPYRDKPRQAWLEKQWELGRMNAAADAIEARDDARIEAWEESRS